MLCLNSPHHEKAFVPSLDPAHDAAGERKSIQRSALQHLFSTGIGGDQLRIIAVRLGFERKQDISSQADKLTIFSFTHEHGKSAASIGNKLESHNSGCRILGFGLDLLHQQAGAAERRAVFGLRYHSIVGSSFSVLVAQLSLPRRSSIVWQDCAPKDGCAIRNRPILEPVRAGALVGSLRELLKGLVHRTDRLFDRALAFAGSNFLPFPLTRGASRSVLHLFAHFNWSFISCHPNGLENGLATLNAQWEDVGPFQIDQVRGSRPRPAKGCWAEPRRNCRQNRQCAARKTKADGELGP